MIAFLVSVLLAQSGFFLEHFGSSGLVGRAMGGLAGVLYGLHYGLVNPYSGFFPGLKAFTAAVLGGIGNIPGAMVGGMVLGLLEAFAASYLSIFTNGAFGAEYKDVFAFVVLILIFGPVSGAHLNPAVSLVAALQRALSWPDAAAYANR